MGNLRSISRALHFWRLRDPEPTPPKQMAKKLVRLLRVERPDYQYLKKVFQHTRSILAISPAKVQKRLPELLTDHELVGFYEAV